LNFLDNIYILDASTPSKAAPVKITNQENAKITKVISAVSAKLNIL